MSMRFLFVPGATSEVLEKAQGGPYIGPRGGRWADPQHKIPWKEELFPLEDFKPVNFYEKCYEYYALDGEPFVPVEETREVMRVLHTCRADSGQTD